MQQLNRKKDPDVICAMEKITKLLKLVIISINMFAKIIAKRCKQSIAISALIYNFFVLSSFFCLVFFIFLFLFVKLVLLFTFS